MEARVNFNSVYFEIRGDNRRNARQDDLNVPLLYTGNPLPFFDAEWEHTAKSLSVTINIDMREVACMCLVSHEPASWVAFWNSQSPSLRRLTLLALTESPIP